MDNSNLENNPRKNVLPVGVLSWMQFMPEHLAYDKESGLQMRYRAMLEIPCWDGVEDNEFEYVVDSPSSRLDKIAYEAYGESNIELYWVIAMRNNLALFDVELYKGKRLLIPLLSWVLNVLLPQANSGMLSEAVR